MIKLTEKDVLEKWAHIAMKVFPPQTKITPGSGADPIVSVRWKAENDPDALSARARGVDLQFPQEMLKEYLTGDAERELKWDTFIENTISERLHDFDPYKDYGAQPQVETWLISPDVPAAAA